MTRWDLLEELFDLALSLDDAARDAWLTRRCADDPSLRSEVLAMIAVASPAHALAIERFAETAPTQPAEMAPPIGSVDPLLGTVIGRWRIVDVLGRGGMASVYRAERADGEYRQQAALKLVSAGACSDEMLDRFRTERQVLAQLSHPNIARLVDGGIAQDGRPYLVMELVDGSPITTWCHVRQLEVSDRLQLFRVVCEAVQHAHGSLVVHRDLKPANTFVTATGEVKLLDFGIAKILAPGVFGVDAGATRDRPAPLTPEYAAPEQLFGGAITTATDVYSLGVLLYELLTGKRPHTPSGTSLLDAERTITSDHITPPSKHLGLPRGDDLDSIVLTALRAQPERRYTSAGQLGEDIGRYLERRPVVARPDTIAYRVRRFVTRNRAAVVVAVLFTLSIVGFGIVALWQAQRATAERDTAQLERDKSEKVIELLVSFFETTNPSKYPGGDKQTISEFLGKLEPKVLRELDGQPVVQARMRHVFGLIHEARDDFAGARALLERAFIDQQLLLGPDNPDTIESMYQLGVVRMRTDDLEGATTLLQDVLDHDLRVYGEDHDLTARTLVSLTRDDRLDEAKQYLDRALAIRRNSRSPSAPALAETIGALAQYYALKRDFARAGELYSEALAVFKTADERRNPVAMELLQGLASVQVHLGDLAGAERSGGEAVIIAEAIYGPDSIPSAQAAHNLGVKLLDHIKPSEAEGLFRKAYARYRKAFGDDYWQTINIERDIALLASLQGRYTEALELFDHALAHLPTNKPTMRHHMQGRRALVLLRLGRGDEALTTLAATLAEATAPNAEDRPYIVVSLNLATAIVLIEMDRGDEAVPFARTGLASAEGDSTIALAKCLVGAGLVRSGRVAEGRDLLKSALPIYRDWGSADPKSVALFETAVAEN